MKLCISYFYILFFKIFTFFFLLKLVLNSQFARRNFALHNFTNCGSYQGEASTDSSANWSVGDFPPLDVHQSGEAFAQRGRVDDDHHRERNDGENEREESYAGACAQGPHRGLHVREAHKLTQRYHTADDVDGGEENGEDGEGARGVEAILAAGAVEDEIGAVAGVGASAVLPQGHFGIGVGDGGRRGCACDEAAGTAATATAETAASARKACAETVAATAKVEAHC